MVEAASEETRGSRQGSLGRRDILNWIDGRLVPAASGAMFDKVSPASGAVLSRVARSAAADVAAAVAVAERAQPAWANTPAVQRGLKLLGVVRLMQDHHDELAHTVASETGKSYKDAAAETAGAIALGLFYSSEGQRLYGRTTTSGVPHRHAMTVRQPIGVAGLIVPANTPIANVAWKVFPALVCGNAAVLKAAEDTPATAWLFARLLHEAGLPAGVLNVVQGYGREAGQPLVEDSRVGVISFTGSTAVGRVIQRIAGDRFARVSLELGGKNPLVVCDDADLDQAVRWTLLSAFSNAGQRCASGSRIIVFDRVYEAFRDKLLDGVARLRIGPDNEDDFGPVISEQQLGRMLQAIDAARTRGARLLAGGHRLTDDTHRHGCYLAATVFEDVPRADELSTCELFGPITCLYPVSDLEGAIALANDSPYGLTAAIHTRSIHRAMVFVERAQAGVVMVNAGTFGSEPHMPFGGVKQSGNGTREPGSEAVDVYSYLKDVYLNVEPSVI